MNAQRTSETSLDQLIDCLRHRPVATTAAQMREAADTLDRLRTVALAAQELVRSVVIGSADPDTEMVREPALTALETALDRAGYDLGEEEFEERLEDREPPEPDGECYRGGEAAAALAEEQAWIQRNLK